MLVTTYQDLLDNDHAALMAECEAIQAQRKAQSLTSRKYVQRSEAAMLAEHNATMWATSMPLINMTTTPWG